MKLSRSAIKLSLITITWMLWSLITLRVEALALSLCALISFSIPAFRRNYFALAFVTALIAIVPFSPVGITLSSAPGGPHLVSCCPFVPVAYAKVAGAVERGECHYCSDLVTGFEPKRYLVW